METLRNKYDHRPRANKDKRPDTSKTKRLVKTTELKILRRIAYWIEREAQI